MPRMRSSVQHYLQKQSFPDLEVLITSHRFLEGWGEEVHIAQFHTFERGGSEMLRPVFGDADDVNPPIGRLFLYCCGVQRNGTMQLSKGICSECIGGRFCQSQVK